MGDTLKSGNHGFRLTTVSAFWFFLVLLPQLTTPTLLPAQETFVTIGGGDFSGVYFPAGLAIAEFVNRGRDRHGIRATVEATMGAKFNLDAILAGYQEFGLTQADKQSHALHGMAEWSQLGPQPDLRSVFSLYHEAVTLVAAVDADVESVADLRGKRVSIGNPGSSQHHLTIIILEAAGLDPEKDIKLHRVSASRAPDLLQDEIIDAYFFTVGHPSDTIRRALSGKRKAKLVPIKGPAFDRLVADNAYYTKYTMSAHSLYPDLVTVLPETVETISVMATLCTSIKVPDRVVYQVTKAVFENLPEFALRHPAFSELSVESAFKGLSAELHPGARRYFQEAGLLK